MRQIPRMSSFTAQFAHPRGALGWFVGHLMAFKNGERSRWALELLAARAGERVLELGFGPGVDVRRLARAVGSSGHVAGVDPSAEMLRQARARNRAASDDGLVDLRVGHAGELPFERGAFDAVYSTNSAQFWPDLARGTSELCRVLRPGGRALLVVQPMWRGASEADTLKWGEKLELVLQGAGFASVTTFTRQLRPVAAVACVGRAEAPRRSAAGWREAEGVPPPVA
jgi:SAM-dependent methyltransferase